MNATPMRVETRPFAIEPVTNVMLPDGIFDNAIYTLEITCHYTNTSNQDLHNVRLYLESVGDPGIAVTGRTYTFPQIAAGASVMLSWSANFAQASPGKPLVSFVARADGFGSDRSIQQIYVSQTRYDDLAHKYVCTVPEGRLEISHIFAIKPGMEWWPCDDKHGCPPTWLGPHLPTGITMDWFPNPAFAGQHGDLPFADPWWKIVAIIVAAIAAIVGIIAAAAGAGTFSPGLKGTFDEDPNNPQVHCCTPNPGGGVNNNATTVAGVCGVITSVAIAVACSDLADPIWRGQENTVPGPGELTVAEHVDAHWTFLDNPNAGTAYRTKVGWKYQRITTKATYDYAVDEEQTNIHVVDKVEVDTPATAHAFKPLWVHAKFTKPDGTLYKGPELYTLVVFRSPGGLFFIERMGDDGLGFDPAANDGVYSAGLDLERALRALLQEGQSAHDLYGVWRVFVYAQEVNRTAPGTPPQVAAQTVGGYLVASAVTITFDPTLPCPLTSQASITVV